MKLFQLHSGLRSEPEAFSLVGWLRSKQEAIAMGCLSKDVEDLTEEEKVAISKGKQSTSNFNTHGTTR